MELISRALCILCIDEDGGDQADLDADTNAMLRAMHGCGTIYHSANRWFDKTVQVGASTYHLNLLIILFYHYLFK